MTPCILWTGSIVYQLLGVPCRPQVSMNYCEVQEKNQDVLLSWHSQGLDMHQVTLISKQQTIHTLYSTLHCTSKDGDVLCKRWATSQSQWHVGSGDSQERASYTLHPGEHTGQGHEVRHLSYAALSNRASRQSTGICMLYYQCMD